LGEKSEFIVKGFTCLSCKHMVDFDCDWDENHYFVCKFDYEEREYEECPMFEEE